MRWLRTFWFPLLLALSTLTFCLSSILQKTATVKAFRPLYKEGEMWQPPDEDEIPFTEEGELIRYGKNLVVATAAYLGPKGSLGKKSNGMNCQNCHVLAGTQNFGNPFSAVASTYPRYRDRSGRVESIEFRINDCMQRSLNGKTLDSQSREMQAMVAYLKWIGKDVPAGVRPQGAGVQALPFLKRAADPQKGQQVYVSYCQRCHGANGQGLPSPDSVGYTYPPLWGSNSYNTGAGMYRLSLLAGFIRNNMPYGVNWSNPGLTSEQAWDVAAFIAAQPRPAIFFHDDWKNLAKKPFDFPFGPYADSFPAQRHKFGPFEELQKKK